MIHTIDPLSDLLVEVSRLRLNDHEKEGHVFIANTLAKALLIKMGHELPRGTYDEELLTLMLNVIA